MYKIFKILTLVIAGAIFISATVTATLSGNWGDTFIWDTGIVPTSIDDAVLNSTVSVRTGTALDNADYEANSLTLNNVNTFTVDADDQLTIGAGGFTALNFATLVVDGYMVVNGDFTVQNSLDLEVNGTLIINGDVVLNNGADLAVNSSGTLTVNGNVTGGNNTDLAVDGTMDVSGDLTTGENSTATGSGSIIVAGSCSSGDEDFCSSSVLPIKLLSFNGRVEHTGVRLSWVTSLQDNFSHFEVQVSGDGSYYETIGTVEGVETGYSETIENYDFIDASPLIGTNYYRLKAVDLDGSFEFHHVIGVTFRGGSRALDIYPNPSTDGRFRVKLNFPPEGAVNVVVYDLNGRVVLQRETFDRIVDVDLSGKLNRGIYQVEIRTDEGWHKLEKLMVN